MKDDSELLVLLLDIQHDISEAERYHLFCKKRDLPRNMNCVKNESWFLMAEGLGFLMCGRFISIHEMIDLATKMPGRDGLLALESIASGLSFIATSTRGDWTK